MTHKSDRLLGDLSEGSHTLFFRSEDKAGNTEEIQNRTVFVDTSSPQSALTVGMPSYQAGSMLYVGGTTSFSLSATDAGSGVKGTEYAVDGGVYTRYAGSFSLSSSGEGEHTLTYRSADNVTNTEPEKSLTVTLDRTAPSTLITANESLSEGSATTVSPTTRFNFLSTDGGSGVRDISYRIDGGAWNTYTGGFSLTGAGSHTIGYRAVDNLGNEEQEKSVSVRLVEFSVTKGVSSRPVVLAGAWGDKKTTEATINTLTSILNSSGYSYSLPSTEEEFKELLRAGRHTTYLLVDFDEGELMDELKGAVHYGDGLVYLKTKSDDEHSLSEVFGVQFKGMSTDKDMEVSFVESELGGAMTLQSSGKAVKTSLTSSTAQGLATVKDKKESYPVVVSSQYGRGKTVLFAFDLLASGDQGTVSSLLTKALGFVAPSEPQARALGEVPVLISLRNSTEPVDLRVTETAPSDTGVESVASEATQTGNGMEWSITLSGNQDKSFEYSLLLPDRAGSYRTETEVRYGSAGEYRLYGQYALDISVAQGSAELLEEVLSDLQGLVLSSKEDTERVNEALEELKELSEVSADVDPIRTKLDELLKVWQGKWSALPEEGKEDKEDKSKEKDKKHSSLLRDRKSVLVATLGSLSGLLNAAPSEEVLYFYHTDHLGTPVLMTDMKGTIVWQGEFGPFGEEYFVSGSIDNNAGFPGQYRDSETGKYYNWHRYYNPETGSYYSFDPILHPANGLSKCSKSKTMNLNIPSFESLLKKPQNLNPYSYALSNPVTNTDPTGLVCGDKSTDAIVPDSFVLWNFESACNGHDECYSTCGNSKSICDLVFLGAMLAECNYRSPKPECYATATLYYSAVVIKGRKAYNEAQREKCCNQK